jgi:hypothetical protein
LAQCVCEAVLEWLGTKAGSNKVRFSQSGRPLGLAIDGALSGLNVLGPPRDDENCSSSSSKDERKKETDLGLRRDWSRWAALSRDCTAREKDASPRPEAAGLSRSVNVQKDQTFCPPHWPPYVFYPATTPDKAEERVDADDPSVKIYKTTKPTTHRWEWFWER